MCGIAGCLTTRPVEDLAVRRMVEALVHRGPDSEGFYRDGNYVAGMRRLAINDLDGGDQPLFSADRRVVLLYNGEIYNYWDLRRRLEAQGCRFRTHADGEVLCHLYARYGERLFEQLDGMFAAALWSARERKLILARDLAGEKPLYYAEIRPGEVAFASEIRALTRFPGLDLSLDRQALWDFPSFLWIPEPATVYHGIKALPPGHLLIVENGATKLRAYENRFRADRPLPSDEQGIISETRRTVVQAIESRLLSDVPIGSFLSSGLDSSIVASVAARKLDRLDTFSIGFESVADPYHGQADESAEAAATARRIGSRHHTIRIAGRDFRAELPRFCRHGDQPFAVSSGLGILAVAKAARAEGIKVLLSGDGADEAFGGYSWYAHLEDRECGASKDGDAIVSFQNFGMALPERLAAIHGLSGPEQAWAWHYYAHEREKAALFSADFRSGLESSLRHFSRYRAADWQPLDYIRQDRAFYFPQEMLRKLDRMTMAYSVEGRVPFAAPSVYALAAQLDFAHLVGKDGTLKTVLRRAFADLLPPEVVSRPKHGFNVPIDHWLKQDWADLVEDSFASGSALRRAGFLAPDARDVARAMLADPQRLNGHTIFCMIMLNLWLEQLDNGNHR